MIVMKKSKIVKYGILIVTIFTIIAVSLITLFSCGAGVDISEADKVLNSFSLTWPEGFDYTCLSNEPINVVIKALYQKGELFSSWDGAVSIELTKAVISVSPASVNLSSGVVERSISFNNSSEKDQETDITLSSELV